MAGSAHPGDPDGSDVDRYIGQVFASRYQIESLLGEGAMGAVYKARHVKVGRPFAVKILHKHLLEDSKVAQRFEREAELAGRLRHPNVIGVVDVGESADGTRYMVMDFAEGEDLGSLLADAPLPPERIIHLCRQILEGLYHAHEAGLIHRDLKPENVIIERDDHGVEVPRIVDFGIAILREVGSSADSASRLTTNGLVLGTPHYMAPEQAVADPIDHRIDLFALGIVIYEMLSGRLPFDGSGAEVARANLLLDPPAIAKRVPDLHVDPLLEAFARRLLQKRRDDRPATAKIARELLDLIARDRVAAAVALGVPVGVATAPQRTEESVPLVHLGELADRDRDDDDDRAAATPRRPVHVSDAKPAFAVTQPRATSTGTRPHAEERDIATDTSQPLPHEDGLVAPPRRRGLALAIGAGVLGAVIAVVVAATRHGGERVPPPATVAVGPRATPPPAQPSVVAAQPPSIVDETPTPVETAGSSDLATAAEPVAATRPIKRPITTAKPDTSATAVTLPHAKPAAKPEPLPVPAPDITRAVAAHPTPAATPLTARSINDRYRTIGQAIAKLKTTDPDAAAGLFQRYRLIQIQGATSSPEAMVTADHDLARLESSLSKSK